MLNMEGVMGKKDGVGVFDVTLKWKGVLIFNNQYVCKVIMHGSRKPNLHVEAVAICSISVANYIRIELEWVPWENCQLIDYLSRIINILKVICAFDMHLKYDGLNGMLEFYAECMVYHLVW